MVKEQELLIKRFFMIFKSLGNGMEVNKLIKPKGTSLALDGYVRYL